MKTTRIKIFQEASYHTIEERFNTWAEAREELLRNQAVSEKVQKDLLQIPPTVLLSFDPSLQKYILTVTYFEIVPD